MSSPPPPSVLPAWPPTLSPAQLDHLLTLATSHALGHGFTLLPLALTTPPTAAIPAPLSLLPTPFPRTLYHRAVALQTLYNALYVEVARDEAFLDEVMGGSVARVDAFQGELWRCWKACRADLVQPLQLGLFRSDYLLHEEEGGGGLAIKQVEFNTISSSFGALSQMAGAMHRYLTAATSYFGASPLLSPANYPENTSLTSLAAGLAEGHRAYGVATAKVLFVVQDGERNVFDQRWLEWELLERHGISVVRHTFDELATLASLSDVASRRLVLPSPYTSTPSEISVVYYRAGYTPADYPSSTAWATRLTLERSRAIKCPSLALQLAGAKKVQQVLAEPGMVERFARGASAEQIAELRETFTDLYPLDESALGREAYALATGAETCARYVLKPQREGGGNNVYREAIPPFLADLARHPTAPGEPAAKEGYILMSLIAPPTGVQNYLVKGGAQEAALGEVVSELGVYGVALFDGRAPVGEGIRVNAQAGTLLRTKGRESDEGGVAVGYSVIDSAVLVD